MKYISYLVLLASILFVSRSTFAQSEGCEKIILVKSSPLYTARSISGADKFTIKSDKRFFMPDKKLKKMGKKQSCVINMHNEVDQDIDVFVDANYVGSIKAGSLGIIKSLTGYEKVYCVSTDKMMTWSQEGDCSCVYVFKLQR